MNATETTLQPGKPIDVSAGAPLPVYSGRSWTGQQRWPPTSVADADDVGEAANGGDGVWAPLEVVQ